MRINPEACGSFGTYAAACWGKAMVLADFSDQQLLAEVAALAWV
jgi:heterodisulfide reductase subunit A-like polyferredoxin